MKTCYACGCHVRGNHPTLKSQDNLSCFCHFLILLSVHGAKTESDTKQENKLTNIGMLLEPIVSRVTNEPNNNGPIENLKVLSHLYMLIGTFA